jgi:YegS/Rv2252/BmrU family lipid kinase
MSFMLHFIVNPAAGNGKSLRAWRRIRPRLERAGIPHAVYLTSEPGDAAAISRRLAGSILERGHESPATRDIIVVISGDGTLREAANGLLDAVAGADAETAARLPALTVIPAGSGNDFARDHGIPMDPLEALSNLLDAARTGRGRRIDVIRFDGGEAAVNSSGAGLDAAVAVAVNRSRLKRLLGRIRLARLAYVFLLIRVLIAYRPADVVLEVDGARHAFRRVWLAAVTNIPSIGGGMRINPQASADDGLLDVCVVHGISRLRLITSFPRVYSGAHASIRGVAFFRGRRIRLESASSLPVHADGEDAGTGPFGVQVEHRALDIVV